MFMERYGESIFCSGQHIDIVVRSVIEGLDIMLCIRFAVVCCCLQRLFLVAVEMLEFFWLVAVFIHIWTARNRDYP